MAIQHKEVIWRGTPRQGLKFNTGDLVFLPFLLLFGLILLFLASVIDHNAVSLIFAAIFLCVLYFRYIDDMLLRNNTSYLITDNEVIINIKSKQYLLAFNNITNAYLDKDSANSIYGSIVFEKNKGDLESHREYMGKYADILPAKKRIGITDIKDYEKVYDLIKNKMNKNSCQ